MARYDYRCTSCGLTFEVEHPMGEHPEVDCPSCGSSAEHVFDASAISFHGSGFFNTDRGSSAATEATTGDTPSPSEAATDAKKCANCPHKAAS